VTATRPADGPAEPYCARRPHAQPPPNNAPWYACFGPSIRAYFTKWPKLDVDKAKHETKLQRLIDDLEVILGPLKTHKMPDLLPQLKRLGFDDGESRFGGWIDVVLEEYNGRSGKPGAPMVATESPATETKPFTLPEEIERPERFVEGSVRRIAVNAYERNEAARRACLEHFGTTCCVCDFDFGKRYGEIGAGYIHVHHRRPLAEVGEEYEVDPIADLRPVCPNCHAMIHRRKPPYDLEELRDIILR